MITLKDIQELSYGPELTRSEKCSMITLRRMLEKRVDRTTVKIGGIDPDDYPDFSDAFIESANWTDGTHLTDDELDRLSCDFIHQCIWDQWPIA